MKILFKQVRAKFGKNCAFTDASIIFTVKFHFGIRRNIRYGTISEMDVVDQKFRISYVLQLNSITVENMKFQVCLYQKQSILLSKS